MIPPQDDLLRDELEHHLRQITLLIERVERMHGELMLTPVTSWQGPASGAFAWGIRAIDDTIQSAIVVLQSARDRATASLTEMNSRV